MFPVLMLVGAFLAGLWAPTLRRAMTITSIIAAVAISAVIAFTVADGNAAGDFAPLPLVAAGLAAAFGLTFLGSKVRAKRAHSA